MQPEDVAAVVVSTLNLLATAEGGGFGRAAGNASRALSAYSHNASTRSCCEHDLRGFGGAALGAMQLRISFAVAR